MIVILLETGIVRYLARNWNFTFLITVENFLLFENQIEN